MALRIYNRYFKTAIEVKAEQHAPAIDAWLKTQTGNKVVTIAELKAGVPAAAGDLSHAVVNQICAMLGLQIENPEDQEA